jgi:starvation-inducible DNA-binding protein
LYSKGFYLKPETKRILHSSKTVKKRKNMEPQIGISKQNLQKSIAFLSSILADEMTLYIKIRKFHWNVAGNSFMELHKLFENQYKLLEASIDEIAERISKLGGKTIGTMKEFSELTRLKENPNKYPSQNDMIHELLKDQETVIVELRKDIEVCSDEINDAGTADFMTGLMEEHETMAWVLRRYLS